MFYRNGLIFAFNFNPNNSLTNVLVPVPYNTDYKVLFCSDDFKYGGNGLVAHMTYPVKKFNNQFFIELYIPARTAIVLKEIKNIVLFAVLIYELVGPYLTKQCLIKAGDITLNEEN